MTMQEQAEKDRQAHIDAARKTYRVLLTRVNKPKPGDGALLNGVLSSLNLTVTDFERDAQALAEMPELQKQRIDPGDVHQAGEAFAAAKRQLEAAQAALRKAEDHVQDCAARHRGLASRRDWIESQIAELRQKHPRAFGTWPEPATPAAPTPKQAVREEQLPPEASPSAPPPESYAPRKGNYQQQEVQVPAGVSGVGLGFGL